MDCKRDVEEVEAGQYEATVEYPQTRQPMAQMSPEVSKLFEEASMLPVEEREALTHSLISTLKGKVDREVMEAWEAEIGKRVAELESGAAETVSWEEVRARNLKKLPDAR